ncbi:MAG: VOC family protein [Thermotaleaceae bacterium]
MKVEHIAMWTVDLERLKDFYSSYFEAKSNEKYRNRKTGFESYFLSFDEGCRLELMQMPPIQERLKDGIFDHIGLAHFAICVGSKEKVMSLTEKLRVDGYEILSEPRTTGDGYFESVISDPDGNRIEITV